jgi:hypothetical protein
MLLVAGGAQAGDALRAERAWKATVQLRLQEAARVLQGAPEGDTMLALERGRMLLYATRYTEASGVLQRSDVLALPEGAHLAELAANCARSTAGALVVTDDEHGLVVRMQDDRDQVLVPILAQVATHARRSIARELGVQLPRPLRIELVRDHHSLSSITGLAEESARTTGTVAVANWGRVAMVSPRSATHGYPWLDTLVHELAHVALSIGTLDRAPLWLQEGAAKYAEGRWRAADPGDGHPSADAVALAGIELGLGRDLDDIGPSVAMLPSAEHAMVVFAEVESFVRYYVREAGPRALPGLLSGLRDAAAGATASDVMKAQTGRDLGAWTQAWRAWLGQNAGDVPAELTLAGPAPHAATAVRNVRLGMLLLERGHGQAASRVLLVAREAAPHELRVRALLGEAFARMGQRQQSWTAVAAIDPPMVPDAVAFSMHGRFLAEQTDRVGADRSFFRALALNPWNAETACEMLVEPLVPAAAERAELCRAARRWPRY